MTGDPRERRTVTVLFSDLSGFTRLSERMDPEEVQDLVDALFQRFRAAIESHGGTVDKFIGDAVMAVFGAPVAHEDDAVRAVRAGRALLEEVAEFDLKRKLGLRVRVGINTGEVLWGALAGEKATAMGDAVNVAQRIESAAAPGTVLVSRAVERGLRGRFLLAGRGSIPVKGRIEPVEVMEVRDELAGQTEHRAAGPPTAFVGREAELERLLERVEGGKGVVLLEGEAGIGKSRLAAEMRREFRERHPGAWVATGRALEGMRLPLAAFGDIVRQEAGVSGLDRGDADRIVAFLVSQVPGESATQKENLAHLIAISLGYAVPGARVRDIAASRVAAETRFAWRRWLECRAANGALLCLEDLHWADAATGEFLAALASLPFAIVATARPGHALPPELERFSLGDLSPSAAGCLGAAVLRAEIDGEVARFLAEQSGGNPLFVEELARFLLDEKLVEGAPLRLAGGVSCVPGSLQGLLIARLDALPLEHKEALKAASVVGRAFWEGFLGKLLGRDAGAALAEARRRELVFPQAQSILPGDRQHVFKHALLRDAAYSLLTKKERQRLHCAAADLLEARVPDAGRRVLALAAGHRDAAGEGPAAGRLWLRASQEASADRAYAEALEHAREAERLGAGPDAVLGVASSLIGLARLPEAKAAAERARGEAGATDDQRARAGTLLSTAQDGLGELEAALQSAEIAVGFPASCLTWVEARIRHCVALEALERRSEALDAAAAAERRIAEAPPDDPRTRRYAADIVQFRGMTVYNLGDHKEALRLFMEVLEMRRKAADRGELPPALANVGSVLLSLGETERGLELFSEAVAAFRASGDRMRLANALNNIGKAHHNRGDAAGALTACGEGLQIFRDIGNRPGIAECLNNLGQVRRGLGESDAAALAFEEAIAICREIGDLNGAGEALVGLANLHIGKDGRAQAREELLEAVRLFRKTGNAESAAEAEKLMAGLEGTANG